MQCPGWGHHRRRIATGGKRLAVFLMVRRTPAVNLGGIGSTNGCKLHQPFHFAAPVQAPGLLSEIKIE